MLAAKRLSSTIHASQCRETVSGFVEAQWPGMAPFRVMLKRISAILALLIVLATAAVFSAAADKEAFSVTITPNSSLEIGPGSE
jgi:hypothetical protein